MEITSIAFVFKKKTQRQNSDYVLCYVKNWKSINELNYVEYSSKNFGSYETRFVPKSRVVWHLLK